MYFLVLFSIVIHGLSIPALSIAYARLGVAPLIDDPVELPAPRSEYEPLPVNAIIGRHKGTVIAYNRFTRPLYYIAATRRPTTTRSGTGDDGTAAGTREDEGPSSNSDAVGVVQNTEERACETGAGPAVGPAAEAESRV